MSNDQQLQLAESPVIDNSIAIYTGASALQLTKDEQTNLLADFDTNQIEIRPDGLIYLPQAFWRQRLNTTLGIGQWALVVKGSHKDPERSKLYLQGVLMIRGCYVAESVGEAEYHENNSNQSWASVWEAAKSDCITRCCKDLGIASSLWQPQFAQAWVAENAVKVFVNAKKWNPATKQKEDKKEVQWRKRDAAPFWNETGLVPTDNQNNNAAPKAKTPAKPSVPITTPDPSSPQMRDERYYKQTNDVELIIELINDPKATIAEIRMFANVNVAFFQTNPELADRIKKRMAELKTAQPATV